MPVSSLDPGPGDRAEPRVSDKFVGACENADGVQLDRAEPSQHPGHATSPAAGAVQALRTQGHQPYVGGGQRELGYLGSARDHKLAA